MPPKRDSAQGAGAGGRSDARAQNGNRPGFRTDTAISNNRVGSERTLQPWVPDANDNFDGSLEKSNSGGGWDQFAENERLFGLKTDYDENIYTTSIDKSHPQYRDRMAAAEKKAREIERSLPTTAHVAEERVMDYNGTGDKDGENEEDKYSGVRRQEFPSLPGSRDNKYTPPAKRAPSAQSSVKGAPVDPAIISSQIKAPAKKNQPSPEQSRAQAPAPGKNGTTQKSAPSDVKANIEPPSASKSAQDTAETSKAPECRGAESTAAVGSPSSSVQNAAQLANDAAPSATSTVERDVLNSFKKFATQQRMDAEKARNSKARADKEVKLTELKRFANTFKLSTPVPSDLVSIIAKDPAKQKEIQAKAKKNAEDLAKNKTEPPTNQQPAPAAPPAKEGQAKPAKSSPTPNTTVDARGPRASAMPAPAAGGPGRHPNSRQHVVPAPGYPAQPYRNNRPGPGHMGSQPQTGNLGQRLRHVEQQRFGQAAAPPHVAGQDGRAPPTGPANSGDNFHRRQSGPSGHAGPKLNPNSHEFKPSPFAATFSPNGQPSAASSPRSSVNVSADSGAPALSLMRRKVKAVDAKKCAIIAQVKSISPPSGRSWEDNGGFRPPYDTTPTWRQAQDDELPDSTMRLTYKEWFERQPFMGPVTSTPNPGHAVPQVAQQPQLQYQMQHQVPHMGPRHSPHVPVMRMDVSQHSAGPHQPYGNDDHRMMQSSSTSSYASPRPGHSPLAYPAVNPSTQAPYGGPMYMNPGTPHMAYRSFSNVPQFMPHQHGHMGGPMMMQPHFMPGPQGGGSGPHMMYPGAHPQFMPPSGPSQPASAANGYHSPGRPAAPMMVHQGSQQGQPMYGMSPNVQYNQPAYGPGQPNGPGQ